ncbi:MAG: tRNA preQ1(34) S-adenosylmethionine ribosyltransferase-isomerase QueA [Christensenellaceae bacterium]|jgi:S-adenosylmethionine:tRNA ribosyltransferase-isomerase|nr:tRNA preQ1(34) S-adenosylmethionine ribosyltransferase-isomerase QueA [Christensenellaceae bacterium]
MNKSDFYYYLPDELIAQTPLVERDSSRLLVYEKSDACCQHKHFSDLKDILVAGDVLVINNTRVIPARIFAKAENERTYEVLLLRRLSIDSWEALLRPARKAKLGMVLSVTAELNFSIEKVIDNGIRIIKFDFEGVFEDILFRVGHVPLPPYIKEVLKDSERYQTIYSKINGSVAAPTAGLHFTPELIKCLEEKGVIIQTIFLHVGLGTFRPVKTNDIRDHQMHSEYFEISIETANQINKAKQEKRRIIAVGTTSVRALESAIDENGFVKEYCGDTSIFIYPPYDFKVVDGIITNFHLPESTLLMLVSAFAGREKILNLYAEAVNKEYRFFSFGDAMLLI